MGIPEAAVTAINAARAACCGSAAMHAFARARRGATAGNRARR